MAELLAALRTSFSHPRFHYGQREAAAALLAGRDVQVLMPTGGGKSLCYQLPAVVAHARGGGTTVVISPLIALMDDQVAQLRARGLAAGALHSSQDELVQREVVGLLVTGRLAILYVSPERAVLSGFSHLLARTKVAHLAVDEAHCISEWGHDFRPEYRLLGGLRRQLAVPTIAVTATATPQVMQDIGASLGLASPLVVSGGFARPNLTFSVSHLRGAASRVDELGCLLTTSLTAGGRALVYCATRKTVEKVYRELKARGFAVGYYHAGRSDSARARAQHAYDSARTPVLVATNAFGMGIDHPDVRLVVHFQTPGSLEAYYQEAGRAGRDGAPAECRLFFGVADLCTQRFLGAKHDSGQKSRKEAQLAALEKYARAATCRQQQIADYFGIADSAPCGVCDVCTRLARGLPALDPVASSAVGRTPVGPTQPLSAPELDLIVSAVAVARRPLGKGHLARALRGSRARALRRFGLIDTPAHGALHHCTEVALVAAIEALLASGRLVRKGKKYPTVWLPGRAVRGAMSMDGAAPRGKSRRARPARSPLWRALDAYRRRTARALRWKTYMVFSSAVIERIDAERPESLYALEQVHGIGPAKVARFGADILALVREPRAAI